MKVNEIILEHLFTDAMDSAATAFFAAQHSATKMGITGEKLVRLGLRAAIHAYLREKEEDKK